MRIRQLALVSLAFVLGATSSFASICDASCSFAQLPFGGSSIAGRRAGTPVDPKMNMGEGMDHSCCRSRDHGGAVTAPHVNMFPDCAVDPALRPHFPAALAAPAIHVVLHGIRLAPIGIDSPKAAETPPAGASSGIRIILVEPVLSSVLRI